MKQIIIKPLLTEKASNDAEVNNRFAFIVNAEANKVEIKKAIDELFGVQPVNVRTMIYGGGKASQKFTNKGVNVVRTKRYKKAIIELAEGDTIDIYGNI
jgi:large subunit ribosomal protein L23